MDSEYINKLAEVKQKTEESIANLQKSKIILDDLTNPRKRVAFHARLSQHVTLGSSQTVIFDDVITNISNAYDHLTGLFTAPYDGVYFFASSFLKTGASPSLHLEMMKNGASISKGHAAAGNASESGSMNAIVSLKLGDVIKIRHFEGTSIETIHGDWSFFTGYHVY
ncbi:C1QL [Mytilus coruscus]|uniref:C1QL n=1 Tax=Mytilus coruscus TaxID=42192 RepID=A0A6J8DZH2_MYTCO|nr:C1QL [Mytilus coruscus]